MLSQRCDPSSDPRRPSRDDPRNRYPDDERTGDGASRSRHFKTATSLHQPTIMSTSGRKTQALLRRMCIVGVNAGRNCPTCGRGRRFNIDPPWLRTLMLNRQERHCTLAPQNADKYRGPTLGFPRRRTAWLLLLECSAYIYAVLMQHERGHMPGAIEYERDGCIDARDFKGRTRLQR